MKCMNKMCPNSIRDSSGYICNMFLVQEGPSDTFNSWLCTSCFKLLSYVGAQPTPDKEVEGWFIVQGHDLRVIEGSCAPLGSHWYSHLFGHWREGLGWRRDPNGHIMLYRSIAEALIGYEKAPPSVFTPVMLSLIPYEHRDVKVQI